MTAKPSNSGDHSKKPICGLLGLDHPEIANSRNLEDDYAVVVVDSPFVAKDFYDPAWGPRCFNDPEGLKRPAKAARQYHS
jgi:hypothetical protein